jgi:L-rhamnonate dehydratase
METAMRIERVRAIPLAVPVEISLIGVRRDTVLSVCLVRIDTDDGITGWGLTAITEEEVVAAAVNEIAAPSLIGLDPMRHEAIWDRLYWLMSPRGQTGYASHAIAAIDLALWDIKGKSLGQPVWRLLGGARDRVPVYTTFGFGFFDRDQLAEAARHWVDQGHRRLKMVVGHHALQRRDEPRPIDEVIREDVHRVRAVREAVGPDVGLYVDANCSLDAYHALKLARQLRELDIAFFEEPITQNDAARLADFRRQSGVPVAAGQNEGLAWRFRELLAADAVDVLQPNVAIGGGFTQVAKIAGMAAAFNVPIANGGAWTHHNMHLHAGLANGTLVEYHYVAVLVCERIYGSLPAPEQGVLALPQSPGLGFDPDEAAIAELAKAPTTRGTGKA